MGLSKFLYSVAKMLSSLERDALYGLTAKKANLKISLSPSDKRNQNCQSSSIQFESKRASICRRLSMRIWPASCSHSSRHCVLREKPHVVEEISFSRMRRHVRNNVDRHTQ